MTKNVNTPGQLLKAAREAQSLSVDDIAKQLRLSVQAILDIEQDDYAQIGVRTFVRGYLCSYARLASVSETDILEALDASGLMPSDTHSLLPRIEGAPVMNVTYQQQSRKFKPRLVVGVSAGVIMLFAFFSWMHSPTKDTIKTAQLNAQMQTTSLSLTAQQPDVATTPTVVLTQPVAVNNKVVNNKSDEKEPKKIAEKTHNGFVIRPTAALHTTYTVKPAT